MLVRDTGIEPDDALRITVEPYLEVRIVCTARDKRVQAVSRCGASMLGTRGSAEPLRSGHGFVAQQLHKRVYADVGAGQFSRVGMPKPVNEGTWDGLRFGASTLEGPLDS